jgi:hypothetical protein
MYICHLLLKVIVFWGTMLCSLVDGHHHFKVTCCLHVQSTKLLVCVNKLVPQTSPFKFWLNNEWMGALWRLEDEY